VSSIVFPDDSTGVTIDLSVLEPPDFTYISSLGGQITQLVISRNVTFPVFSPQWSIDDTAIRFPVYYYDEVIFRFTPSLPGGIGVDESTGDITPDPLPEATTELLTYAIRVQSVYAVPPMVRESQLELSVEEPAQCALQSVRSTDVLVSITMMDCNNLYNQAVYFLVADATQEPPAAVRESFPCYGQDRDRGGDANAELPVYPFVCTKEGSTCCCWLWLPGGSDTSSRDVGIPQTYTGRIPNGDCD
jgi:hypothetical protein